jgi:hypothetical protein
LNAVDAGFLACCLSVIRLSHVPCMCSLTVRCINSGSAVTAWLRFVFM